MNSNLDSDTELTTKIELIQNEIIDDNYNKESFINYCLIQKENGDDLNSWTVDELKQTIKEYKNSKAAKIEEKEEEEIKKETIEKIESFNTASAEDKQKAEYEINCRKLETTVLNSKDIKISISDPHEVETGIFANNYISYKVSTQPMKWNVERRYNDFDWLRRMLSKMYIGHNIPPLPNKKIGTRRFQTDFINKRMKFLQLFINAVCEDESFKTSEALISFLKDDDRTKFESKMKEFETYQPSYYVEDLKTFNAKVTVSHSEINDKYFTNINKFFDLQSTLLHKLNFNIKQFYNNINEASKYLAAVQNNFELLHVLNSRVSMRPFITDTYEELGFFFRNWKKVLIKQNELIKDKIKEFFKFINMEGQAYCSLLTKREELNQNYKNELYKLNSKKEKLFSLGDISKFELDPNIKNFDENKLIQDKAYAFEHICFNDSQNLNKIYEQLGYFNKKGIHELKKIIKIWMKRFKDNFKEFNQKFYISINDVYYIII